MTLGLVKRRTVAIAAVAVSVSAPGMAAGAQNRDAVFQHCASKYTLQRASQLEALHKGLRGDAAALWPMSNLEPPR